MEPEYYLLECIISMRNLSYILSSLSNASPLAFKPEKISDFGLVRLLSRVRRRASNLLPGHERILRIAQTSPELGEVTDEHVAHGVVLNPGDAGGCVDLRNLISRPHDPEESFTYLILEVRCDKSVALQAARSHQDEHAEGGVAEAEALW